MLDMEIYVDRLTSMQIATINAPDFRKNTLKHYVIAMLECILCLIMRF